VTPRLAWVLGEGGFLGRHVKRRAGRAWSPPAPFPWDDPERLDEALDRACAGFARAVRGSGAEEWSAWWCAGAGGVGTPESRLEGETRAFARLLDGLARELPGSPGVVVLSSSAGGVHGEAAGAVVTESTPCRPLSPYGRNKLHQEELLASWVDGRYDVRALVARLSNLYGPGQDLSRPTGLVAHLSRNLVFRRPTHVYVPLDTLRDLLYVEDAAADLVRCAERLASQPPRTRIVKIFASSRSISVAALLGLMERIAPRGPRVVAAPARAAAQQPLRHRFRSEVWTDLGPRGETPLEVGIQRVVQEHLALHQEGRLPAPTIS
jgi:UDP-glucose 4-epimerase